MTESLHNYIPEGTTFTVIRDHTNQFTERRVLTLEIEDTEIVNRVGSLQVYQKPEDSVWTEIHVGLSREHEEINFDKEV